MNNELKYNNRDDDFKTLYKKYLNESICKRRIINRVFIMRLMIRVLRIKIRMIYI